MSIEYLRNAETDAETARIREEFSRDAEATVAHCKARVAEVVRAVREAEELISARAHACQGALHRIREKGEAMTAGFPASRSLFSQPLTRAELERLCYAVTDVENAHRDLRQTLLLLAETGERLNGCRMQVLRAQRLVYGIKPMAAQAPYASQLLQMAQELCAQDACCTSAWERLMKRRETWGAFSAETLPRFCDGVRRFADLSHGGEGSQVAAIRQLCSELCRAVDRVL